mmetsp:Transcript_89255/g.193189  ORF Transcript_89255/g.193189 Transcript_89255/m.193189 type:complete len:337 (-) Transcript_89255:440-1450(-)
MPLPSVPLSFVYLALHFVSALVVDTEIMSTIHEPLAFVIVGVFVLILAIAFLLAFLPVAVLVAVVAPVVGALPLAGALDLVAVLVCVVLVGVDAVAVHVAVAVPADVVHAGHVVEPARAPESSALVVFVEADLLGGLDPVAVEPLLNALPVLLVVAPVASQFGQVLVPLENAESVPGVGLEFADLLRGVVVLLDDPAPPVFQVLQPLADLVHLLVPLDSESVFLFVAVHLAGLLELRIHYFAPLESPVTAGLSVRQFSIVFQSRFKPQALYRLRLRFHVYFHILGQYVFLHRVDFPVDLRYVILRNEVLFRLCNYCVYEQGIGNHFENEVLNRFEF